jgi:lytic murein transglycosylase
MWNRLSAMRLAGLAFCLACTLEPAVGCQENFDVFLDGIRKEASAAGISSQTTDTALNGLTPDKTVIAHDRGQGVFRQSFEQFSHRMVNSFRLTKGASLLRQHAATLARVEKQFGVPGPVLVAIWGLETDFGAYLGSFPTIRSLATLANDCRRSDMFRAELIDALRLVERGDLTPGAMHGAWAGELGQTQFMPSSYLKFAVDFDGDGRRDLIHSVPDVLASTANYLAAYGWQSGADWSPGTANFNVLLQWNKSQVYSKTVAYFATRLEETSRK